MPSDSEGLQRALAALVAGLCAIPSVTREEGPLRDHVLERLGGTPFAAESVGNALVARGPSREGRPLVTLFGHLDTVPPAAPNPVRVEGDRLYGLGASDMKSGLAVMIELARRLDPDRLAFDLGLVFYDREEGPFKENGLERLLNEIPWLSGTTLGIVLEPTDLAVQMGCQGSIQSRVIFTGRSAHSARPWLGDNAIVKAGPFLTAMASSRPVDVDVQGLRFRECFTVTMARGGRAPNVVPDRVEFVLNFRFSPRRTLPEAREALRAFLDGLDLPASHRPELEIFDEAPSCPVYRDHPLVRAFVERAGVPVEPKQAWTDVARLAVHGIPAFNYGPGLVQQCHQAAEHTLVSHLDAAFDVLRSFLEAPVRESA